MSQIALILILAAANGGVHADSCYRVQKDITVDFEYDESGRPLAHGDVPFRLPYGVQVTGKRKGNNGTAKSDLQIFDSARPSESNPHLNPMFYDAKNVLIISEKGSSKNGSPDDSEAGGYMDFQFDPPVLSLDGIKFLSTGEATKITATLVDGTIQEEKISDRSGDIGVAHTCGWRDVKALRIEMNGPGALVAIYMKGLVCDGE